MPRTFLGWPSSLLDCKPVPELGQLQHEDVHPLVPSLEAFPYLAAEAFVESRLHHTEDKP
ncbi:hypothetical protein D3C86_2178360 [compost metagenome]